MTTRWAPGWDVVPAPNSALASWPRGLLWSLGVRHEPLSGVRYLLSRKENPSACARVPGYGVAASSWPLCGPLLRTSPP